MNVLDNGLDSFVKSIKGINSLSTKIDDLQYEFALKEIIISLHHSIETLFKHLISEKSTYLIYKDLDQLFKNMFLPKIKNNYKVNQCNTIEFLDAVQRVLVLYEVDIEENEYNRFVYLNSIRNAITHYEWHFENEIAEHTISLLVSTLFRIYKTNLSGFDSFVVENGLISQVTEMDKNNEMWKFEKLLLLNEKIILSNKEIEILDSNPIEKQKIYSEKQSEVEYIKCRYCNNERFMVTGSLIVNSIQVEYLGKCKYCKIELYESDIHLLNILNVGNNFKRVNLYLHSSLSKLLSCENGIRNDYGQYTEDIRRLFTKHDEILTQKSIIHLKYIIDEIFTFLATKYFEDEIYYYNDVTERLVEDDSGIVELDDILLIEKYLDREEGSNEEELCSLYDKLIINMDNYSFVTGLNSDEIFEKMWDIDYFESYHNAYYHNFNNEEREFEISIRVNFNMSIFKKTVITHMLA